MRRLNSKHIFLLALMWPCVGSAAPIQFHSGPKKISLLEVYSSEGCSSCPPAEKWLTSLKNSSGLWSDYIPVCFHVDYWDYLGWKDILGASTYSDRQRQMAKHWNMRSVYTPGFFLNGQEWRGWFNGHPSLPSDGKPVGSLIAVNTQPLEFKVTFQSANSQGDSMTVEGALMGMDIVSKVGAGENRGRTLQHDFAVLELTSSPLVNGAAHLKFSIPPSQIRSLAVAFWVLKKGDPRPLQAVGGELPSYFSANDQ